MTRPASVAAEFQVPCKTAQSHRVWVHRDGSVTTPDHDLNGSEKIEQKLGYTPTHACQQFVTAAGLHQGTHRDLLPATPIGWELVHESMWTPRAGWTANTAITGEPIYQNFPPALTLAYMQVYLAAGETPRETTTHLQTLLAPWMRTTGARRYSPVMPEELADILDAGIPTDRAASSLAMGLTGELVRSISAAVGQRSTPDTEMLMLLSYALHPQEAERLIRASVGITSQQIKTRCAALKRTLEESSISDADAVLVLFPAQ